MSDLSVEQWTAAVEMSTGARLRQALDANQALAVENYELRQENASLRRQLQARGHAYHLTDKGLAALQANTKEKK